MNIEQVLKSVEDTIKKYKVAFPELAENANFTRYNAETIEAILAYEKKATLISKELVVSELEKHFNTAKEIFDESFHKSNKKGEADNLLIGMLEMAWIESFLNEINNFKSEIVNSNLVSENNILEYNTYDLLEILIKKDNLLRTDYLQFVEKYNINTPEKLKTFYIDYVYFATRKINLKIIEFFKNKESQDYIINVLLKSAIKDFKSSNNYVFAKPAFLLFDDIFILNHRNIFIKAEEIFINGVINLATDKNIFSEWDSIEEEDFWEKFSKSNYFDWLNFPEINSSVRTISFLSKEILSTEKNENTLSVQQPKDNNEKPLPTIKTEAIPIIFEILKDFFDARSQNEFKTILETFGNTNEKLNFKSNGNQLADTFKKLFDNHFITGLQKNDLINWIALNFNFLYRSKVTDFKTKTLELIISGNQNPCKNPIIEIKNGQISKIHY